MIKVLLYGVSTAATEGQKELISKLENDWSHFTIKNQETEFADFNLIIAHDGLPANFKQEHKWLIGTSLSKTDVPPPAIDIPGTINWNTLLNGLEEFLSFTANKESLTIYDFEKLFGNKSTLIKLHKILVLEQLKGRVAPDSEIEILDVLKFRGLKNVFEQIPNDVRTGGVKKILDHISKEVATFGS